MNGEPVLTVAQVQAAEAELMAQGVSVHELMRRAGEGAAQWVWRFAAGRPVTVLCGPGNNGGDGYVIAQSLYRRGLKVQLIAPLAPRSEAAIAARAAYEGPLIDGCEAKGGGVLIDCLFGTGLKRPLDASLVALLRECAARHGAAVAIDLPSAVESDSGALLNEGLPSHALTLALGAWKFAHWRLAARAIMGEKRLVPIGIRAPRDAARLVKEARIDPPALDVHKYRRGLLAVISGAMPGAGLLACEAAMRAGAGYVKLLAAAPLACAPAGLVVVNHAGSADEAQGAVGPDGDPLGDPRISAQLIGPGLGRGAEARRRLAQALCWCRSRRRPTLLDADALVLLDPDDVPGEGELLATPHEGEMQALCRNFGVHEADPVRRALALANKSGMVICAKGPDTLVAAPDGRLAVMAPATSWLSVAGSGDCLAGIAASRMASGRSAFDAGCEGVVLHGIAARLAGPAFTADDLARQTSRAVALSLA